MIGFMMQFKYRLRTVEMHTKTSTGSKFLTYNFI